MTPAALCFLADESCDFAAVHALRTDGYDVQAVRRVMQEQGEQLLGAFVVLQPGHTRISRQPEARG